LRSSGAFLCLALAFALCAQGQSPTANTAKWHHVDVGPFSFLCPDDIVENRDAHAIDSFAKQYRSPGVTLDFDYGQYSNNLLRYKESSPPIFPTHQERINGRDAWIGSFRAKTVGNPLDRSHKRSSVYAGAYFPRTNEPQYSLIVWVSCKTKDDCAFAEATFRSVRFK
jgi:hypothetical protein